MEDIFDVGAPVDGAPGLVELHRIVEVAFDLQEVIETMENDLKRMKNELQRIKTNRIPELMAELQIENITHKGVKVKISEFVSGSLPKEEGPRAKAIEWLEAHDGGSLIKTDVSLKFGRSQHNEAMNLVEDLRGSGFEPNVTSGVHSQTLCAYVRERLSNGEPVDTDILGVYTGKVAKLERAKA
jgi:hypothetical protein